jgi:hypothetical protein
MMANINWEKIGHFGMYAVQAVLLAAGVAGESGNITYGLLVIFAFIIGRMSKN